MVEAEVSKVCIRMISKIEHTLVVPAREHVEILDAPLEQTIDSTYFIIEANN